MGAHRRPDDYGALRYVTETQPGFDGSYQVTQSAGESAENCVSRSAKRDFQRMNKAERQNNNTRLLTGLIGFISCWGIIDTVNTN